MKIQKLIILLLSCLILCSCTSCDHSETEIIDLLSCVDSIPPSLIYIKGESPYSFTLNFSEELKDRFSCKVEFEGEHTTNFKVESHVLTVFTDEKLTPGKRYHIKAEVQDLRGNSTMIESMCYAKNTNPAKLLISEISTKGTKKYGDRVELICTDSGCLAGITIANGFNYNYEDRCVLPNVDASAGDLFVIGFGKDTEADYKSENLDGLSSNNGCIIISETADVNSPIQDCIIYSNKTSSTFNGFANRHIEEVATTLIEKGEWETGSPLSSNAMNTTYETSTRTINRFADKWGNYKDTNTQDDFYITVTSGQTFGKKNNPKIYEIPED